jgi:hypothetical protein
MVIDSDSDDDNTDTGFWLQLHNKLIYFSLEIGASFEYCFLVSFFS